MSGQIYPSFGLSGSTKSRGISGTTTSAGKNALDVNIAGGLDADIDVDNENYSLNGYIGKTTGGTGDFVTAYQAATGITLSSLPGGITAFTAEDIISVLQINSTGTVVATYTRDDAKMAIAGGILTITGATFAATDTFVVYTNVAKIAVGGKYNASAPTYSDGNYTTLQTDVNGNLKVKTTGGVTDDSAQVATPPMINVGGEYRNAETTYTDGDATILQTDVNGYTKVRNKSYDSGTTADKNYEVSPIDTHYVSTSLLDTTNLAAATNYYPASTGASMDGYKDLSLSGKFIDGDGTFTLTVEAMNDEDTTSGDWIQVYGYDDKNNLTTNSWTVTNGTLTFAISFNDMNYRYYRIKVVNDGATNTAILKSRRKAL